MDGQGFSVTRWDALGSALAATLPAIDSSTQLGALLFPASPNSGNCSVSKEPQLAPASGNGSAVLSILQHNVPGGATPTDWALESAATALLATRTLASARAMVIATDGGPDCNIGLDVATCRCTMESGSCVIPTQCLDDRRTIDHIAKYREQGLYTYVIGIQSTGDSSFSDVLDAMAVAGGRPQPNAPQKYYAARSPEELNAAMVAIGQLVGACVFLTNTVPNVGSTLVLNLDGIDLAENKWSWQDRDNGELVLDAAVCSQLRVAANPKLTARIACAPSNAI